MQLATLAALFALTSSHVSTAQGFLGSMFPCGLGACGIVVANPGNNPPATSRSADCSSFLRTTVQPTLTSTIYSSTTSVTIQLPTTLTSSTPATTPSITRVPTSVPTYALICGVSGYRSACSCLGVAGNTITLGPTTTITTVLTNTITSPASTT
ncbi:hypothetical protein PspLS_04111 [Pyricularia sp. CBS 133598]|nr:hypothetical protein PspLS_04111 [Pyricularia sp. CBS 133598]